MNPFSIYRAAALAAALLVLSASFIVSAPAEASIIDWVTTVSAQQPPGGETLIVVASDGNQYTQVTDGRVDLWAKSYGLCKKPSKWGRTALYIHRLKNGGTWKLNDRNNFGYEDKRHSIEFTKNKVHNLSSKEKQAAVNLCNQLLSDQMNQGKTRREVLSKDQNIFQPRLFQVEHLFYCGGQWLDSDWDTDKYDMVTPIRCEKSDFPTPGVHGQGPGNIATHFQVTSASLDVNPEQSSVVTKANLTVSGEIVANRAGNVKIRVSHNGKPGPLSTIRFDKAGKETFSFPLTIPCPPSGTSTTGSGGGLNELAGAPQGTINGHLEFRVISPRSPVKKSNKTFYSVTCRPTPTMAPKLPDLVVDLKNGTSTPLLAEVRNVGSAPSTPTKLEVRFPKSTTHLVVPALGPGKSADIPINYPPGAGSDQQFGNTEVIVDQPPVVGELNENNNSSKKKG